MHPTSVLRVMRRCGFSGRKFGEAKQAGRRFFDHDVQIVERVAGVNAAQKAIAPQHDASTTASTNFVRQNRDQKIRGGIKPPPKKETNDETE